MSEFQIAGSGRDVVLEDGDLENCQACAPKRVRPAVGRSTHPDYRHLAFCAECIALYNDARLEWVDVS
jgi:hypothetical protein